MLRYDRIRGHEIGPFHELDVDLSALPALVAIVGPNGAGKSTFLELLAAGATRECPTRGSLASLARGRDSWVEVACVNGKPWTIRQNVDALSKQGESIVTDALGAAVLTSTKVREFDAWAAANLPSPEVLYSSTFGVQGSAGFLALKPSDRKAVLLRVLGIERFERMATKAREELAAARARHATASALVEAVVGGSVADAETSLASAAARRERAAMATAAVRIVLESARVSCGEREAIVLEARSRSERREQVSRRLDTLIATIRDAEGRIANNRALVDTRGEIEAAVARLVGLRVVRPQIEADILNNRAEERRLDDAIATACASRLDELDRWASQCDARERRATPTAALRSVVDEAIASLDAHRAAATEAERVHEAAIAEAEALAGQAIAGAEQRIVGLRGGLTRVLDTAVGTRSIAEAALAADDASVTLAETLPTKKAAARAKLVAAADACQRALRTQREAEALASRLDEVKAAQVELIGVAAERGQIADARATLATETAAMRANRETIRARLRDLTAEQAKVAADIGRIEPIAARAEKLAAATARIEELEASLSPVRAERATLEAQLAEMGTDDVVVPPPVDVAGAERDVRHAESTLARETTDLALYERDLSDARERDSKRAVLAAGRDAIAEQISDWKRLADDLGRDGIQALEIDAAGPQLSALANDLLHVCVGPRWTVTIDTQRMGADGRLLESLEVRVLDTEAGRDAPVETYSGGERVLLGEAVSLALAMLACQRSGQRDVTIVRDESGAALDGERGRAYVAMLRRALVLTGARQVLLVTHSPDVAELCDARLHVEGGKVEVRS